MLFREHRLPSLCQNMLVKISERKGENRSNNESKRYVLFSEKSERENNHEDEKSLLHRVGITHDAVISGMWR